MKSTYYPFKKDKKQKVKCLLGKLNENYCNQVLLFDEGICQHSLKAE